MLIMALWLIACLFWSVTAVQPEVNPLVAGIQAKYSTMSTFSADFVQVYTAPSLKPRRESGHVSLKKPGRMRWEYSDPERKVYVSDGREIVEYVDGDKFASRTSARDFDSVQGPFRFLLGKFNLRSDFGRIEVSGEAPIRAGCRVLRLIPKVKDQISEVLIEVFADFRLSRVTLIRSDRSRTDFIFSNIVENQVIEEAIFKLNLPKGISVRNGRK